MDGGGGGSREERQTGKPLEVASHVSVIPGSVRGSDRRGAPSEPLRAGQAKGYVRCEP